LLWSAGLRLGVSSLAEPWRPGYHKIGSIEKGSPVDDIGIKPGDVIVAIDGKVVGRPADVRRDIKGKDQITIIFHDGTDLWEVVAELKPDPGVYGAKVAGKPEKRKLTKPMKEDK
jgi:predicted metalloprotease with PDZ domain